MKRPKKWLFTLATLLTVCTATSFAGDKYVIVNDGNLGYYPFTNNASFYSVGSSGALTLVTTIAAGGLNEGGGAFAVSQLSVLRSKTNNCTYIGNTEGLYDDGSPGNVAAIDMSNLTLAGTFSGLPTDYGELLNVGLAEAPSGTFLFASYSSSSTIATYRQLPNCKLKRLSEIITAGAKRGNFPNQACGMKVTPNGNFLIVAYGDGSIGSYAINPATGALTLINRYLVTDGGTASGVDITADSRWALFGDANDTPEVEVAAIRSDGSLGPTTGYAGIGLGTLSNNVWLSPDESVVYITNNGSGQITAAPFDKGRGVINIAAACTSAPLKGYLSDWVFLGNVITGSTEKTGSPLYVAEPGAQSGIGILDFSRPCTLTETADSPTPTPAGSYPLTVGTDPPRSF
jgi:hypothetical protein